MRGGQTVLRHRRGTPPRPYIKGTDNTGRVKFASGVDITAIHAHRYHKSVLNRGRSRLGKVPETHSVDSAGDDNFSVFTVTEIALKITNAVPPMHLISRTPNMANLDL